MPSTSPVAVERNKASSVFPAETFHSIFELNKTAFSLQEHKSGLLEREITFMSVIPNSDCFQEQTLLQLSKTVTSDISVDVDSRPVLSHGELYMIALVS